MFETGNQYGKLTKRGVNKTAKETKELVNRILFNEAEFVKDWQEMDVHARMELRIKMARFIMPEPKEAVSNGDTKDLPLFLNTQEEILEIMQDLELTEDQLIQMNHDQARDI